MTYDEWVAEAKRRFGESALEWRFKCPACGDEAAVKEWPADKRWHAGQECIGRTVDGRGCDWAAYGLIPGPIEIERDEGTYRAFEFAEVAS